jgi:polyphenol oxidase
MRFELPGSGRALFTTRAYGNLSTTRGEGQERGGQTRERLREELGLSGLCVGHQVHGTTVRRVRTGSLEAEGRARVGVDGQAMVEADGHATALCGVGVMVLAADCLPVVLGSGGAVAALHVGWRGLAAGVLDEGVRALRELDGRDREGGQRIVAVIGPGAGPCCYEVGDEVHAAFGGRSEIGRHLRGCRLDLAALASERLAAAGVERIERVEVCTICDAGYFSHRREGPRAGRHAAVAWRI